MFRGAFVVSAICVPLFIIGFWQTFSFVPLHEAGDFAANSLLVLQANHFSLLVDNYFRIGFNHPGPALLYVLAAGEAVFFDLTRWVTSPFSGQIYAVALLSGFWIASIGALLRRMQGSMPAAVITAVLFVGVAAYINYQAFAGTWFQHVYYFVFAAFTVSLASEAQIGATHGRYVLSAVPKEGVVNAANVAGLYFYPQGP